MPPSIGRIWSRNVAVGTSGCSRTRFTDARGMPSWMRGLDHARGEGAPIDADLEPVRGLVDVREEDPADVEQAPHARVPGGELPEPVRRRQDADASSRIERRSEDGLDRRHGGRLSRRIRQVDDPRAPLPVHPAELRDLRRDLTEQLAQGPPGARDDRQTHRCGLDDRHRAHDEHADDGQGEEDPREPSKSYHLPTLGRAKNFRYMTVTLSIEGIERHRGETVGEKGSIIVVVLRGRNALWNPPGDMRDEPSPAGWRFPDSSFIGMRPSPTRRDRRSSRASASSWPANGSSRFVRRRTRESSTPTPASSMPADRRSSRAWSTRTAT